MVKVTRPDTTKVLRGSMGDFQDLSDLPPVDLAAMGSKVIADKVASGKKIKILGICGSPRKAGNTETMLKWVLDTCEKQGAETELILLRGKNLKPCDACESCEKTGRCHQKDDMQEIYPKLFEADGIVYGSPTYGMGITPEIKILFDRAGGLHAEWMTGELGQNGEGFLNTVGGAVITAGRTGASLAWSTLAAEFTLDKWIYAGAAFGYAWDKGEIHEDNFGKVEARELGLRMISFINMVRKSGGIPMTRPSLSSHN